MLGSKRYTPDFVRLRCRFQFVLTLTNGFRPVGLAKGTVRCVKGSIRLYLWFVQNLVLKVLANETVI
jgi:hypothetical protein